LYSVLLSSESLVLAIVRFNVSPDPAIAQHSDLHVRAIDHTLKKQEGRRQPQRNVLPIAAVDLVQQRQKIAVVPLASRSGCATQMERYSSSQGSGVVVKLEK
jgi:hypothetical protein